MNKQILILKIGIMIKDTFVVAITLVDIIGFLKNYNSLWFLIIIYYVTHRFLLVMDVHTQTSTIYREAEHITVVHHYKS